jgi:hypothetical protein
MHAALELAFGIVVMASPLVLGVDSAGGIIALVLGALLVGLALTAASDEGQGGLSIGAHAAADQAIAVTMIGLASVLGILGDVAAFAFLAIGGAIQLLLHANTRYSAARA